MKHENMFPGPRMVSFFALTMRICLIRQVVVCKHKKVHENEKGEMKNAAERKGQILRSTPNTAPLICGACNTQPEGLSTMA